MASPIWITASGILGVIPETVYYEFPFDAYNEAGGTLTYKVIAGKLPAGLTLSQSGLLSGIPTAVTGITTYTFTVRVTNSTNNIADRTFQLTIGGLVAPIISPDSSSLGTYIDGMAVDNIQLTATEPIGTLTATFRIISGALPPGLTLSSTGKISGYIEPALNPTQFGPLGTIWSTLKSSNPDYGPSFDWQNPDYPTYVVPFDSMGFDISSGYTNKTYQFTVEASDGVLTDIATYSIFVYSRQGLTADMDTITADYVGLITADTDTIYTPVLLTKAGNLGNIRQNTLFQYKLNGIDYDGDNFVFNTNTALLPTGLTLNSTTGWITGIVPYGPLGSVNYPFDVNVSKVVDGTTYVSDDKRYVLKVQGQVSDAVNWITSSNLGTIYNGDISELQIAATTESNRILNYALVSSSIGGLPIGLDLLLDGTISGRVSFQLSENTTYTFTVAAYDNDNLVYDEKEFSVTVVKRDQQPYENLYIQALPNREQRSTYDSIINNSDIFPVESIYRYSDPWFGKNLLRRSLFMTGLNPAEVSDYITAMSLNHYWKTINFKDVKTAQALDDNFNVKYEVVYLELVDNAVNSSGLGPNLSIGLPQNNVNISVAYPNSFPNMAQRLATGVGYENRSILPDWMTSRQTNGTVLGFTRALVLCYTVPGKAAEVAFRVKQIADQFSTIDFTIDRYEWDSVLSDNWIKGNVSGTGNITANTQSANIIGTGTNFVFELSGNSIIYSNNVAIGVVDQVISSNLVTLTANATANVSAQPFEYSHTFIVDNYTAGSGTITTQTNSNVVLGSNTIVAGSGNISGVEGNVVITGDQYTSFNTELGLGKTIYVANVALGTVTSISSASRFTISEPLNANITNQAYSLTGNVTAFTEELHLGDIIVANGVVLGTVKTITDDFELILTANATANVADQTFTHTARDPYTVPGQGDKYLKFPNIRVITSEFTTPEH